MMGLPLHDKDNDDAGVYNKLLERVNEALGRGGVTVEGSSTSDIEASLLHKVEEVLSALGSDSNGQAHDRAEGGDWAGGGKRRDFALRDALRSLDTSTSSQTTTHTTTYELSPRHLALDLSLADGTYRMEDPTQLTTLNERGSTSLHRHLHFTPQSKRSSDLFNPILEANSAFNDSLLEVGKGSPSNNRNREKANGGMAGGVLDIPRIEYESFVDDDTLAEVRRRLDL